MKILNKKSVNLILLAALSLTALSCAQGRVDPFDVHSGLTRSEIEDALIRKANKKTEAEKKSAITSPKNITPKISSLVMAPPPPVLGGDKIISFSVTDQVPLKDLLIELGRIANIDIDIDSSISGSVIINAKDRPLKEVIDRIANMGNLRYSYKNSVLFFENDAPYMKNYFADYLIGGTLWGEVETNIKAIMTSSEITSAKSEGQPAAADTKIASFTSNKSAGIISAFASAKQHQAIAKYLKDVEKHSSAQVLIEAKVVEVTLSKDFAAGIDWTWADSKNSAATDGVFRVGDTTTPYVTALFGGNSSITSSVKALEQFGTAKAISSPRITTMNNQNATLNFSENLIYFTISTSASTVAGLNNPTTVASVTATKNEIPIGVQLSITPSINVATGEVTLDIQPTLSVDSGKEAIDPSINPTTGESLGNKIPIVKTRTLKTLAKIQSGNVLVIGGLMSDTTADTETGVPFLSRIPILGYLFKYSSKTTQVVETVIFIKATIVDSSGFAPKEDRELEEKFDVNKRKLF